jgi:hypothetical protein
LDGWKRNTAVRAKVRICRSPFPFFRILFFFRNFANRKLAASLALAASVWISLLFWTIRPTMAAYGLDRFLLRIAWSKRPELHSDSIASLFPASA